jgi:hypothetical protein
VLLTVTAPVDPDIDIPVPATIEVTPVLLRVVLPPNATGPPPDKPVPAVTVTCEFCSPVLSVCPAVLSLFANCDKLNACVIRLLLF